MAARSFAGRRGGFPHRRETARFFLRAKLTAALSSSISESARISFTKASYAFLPHFDANITFRFSGRQITGNFEFGITTIVEITDPLKLRDYFFNPLCGPMHVKIRRLSCAVTNPAGQNLTDCRPKNQNAAGNKGQYFFSRTGVIFVFGRRFRPFSSFSITKTYFHLIFTDGMLNNKIEFTSINRINNYGLNQ